MKFLKIVPITLAVFLTACGGEPTTDFMGYWQQDDMGSLDARVAKIYKDGDTFLIDFNIYKDTNAFGRSEKPQVLSNNGGKLSINTGLGAIELGLSENKDKLYVSDQTYSKIDEAKANEIQDKLSTCKELRQSFVESIKSLGYTKEAQEKRNQIELDYKAKFQPYTGTCNIPSTLRTR